MNDSARQTIHHSVKVADASKVTAPQSNAEGNRSAGWTVDRPIYVQFVEEHDQWYAEALDFRIVGVGDTRDEARRTMLKTLKSYLDSCRRDGSPKSDVLQVGSMNRRLRVARLKLAARFGGSRLNVERLSAAALIDPARQRG